MRVKALAQGDWCTLSQWQLRVVKVVGVPRLFVRLSNGRLSLRGGIGLDVKAGMCLDEVSAECLLEV